MYIQLITTWFLKLDSSIILLIRFIMSDKRNPFASSSDSEDEPDNQPENQKHLA